MRALSVSAELKDSCEKPGFWLKDIHVTLQFARSGGVWVPVSFDAIATIRFLGQYTLAGLNVRSSECPIHCTGIAINRPVTGRAAIVLVLGRRPHLLAVQSSAAADV